MHHPSFWSAFEETADKVASDTLHKTYTRAREEPDQRMDQLSGPTKTLTAAREEDDQDPSPHSMSVFPRARAYETNTITKTREELDKSPDRSSLAIDPQLTMAKTLTSTREQPDQDRPIRHLAVLPRAGDAYA